MSPRGKHYATALTNYIRNQEIDGLRVWTSWLKRTIQTVEGVVAPQERWKALNEIDAVRYLEYHSPVHLLTVSILGDLRGNDLRGD